MERETKVNSPEVVDEVVSTWVDVTRIPTIASGHFTESEHFLNITSQWSVLDLGKKEAVRFQRSFSILKSSLDWNDGETLIDDKKLVINASAAVPFDGKKICVSKDGSRKAILVEKGDASGGKSGEQKAQLLQIWSGETLLKTYDLAELDKHKSVYTNGTFGNTMVWNETGVKLAYLAEKKVSKPKPFFSSNVKVDDNGNKDDEKDGKGKEKGPRGEEFALRQTWGEQLEDMYSSVVVVLDITRDKFEVIEFPNDEFPTDIQWIKDTSIVGTSYKIPVWRLGLIYCSNRESRIFQVDVDGNNLRFLSKSGRGAFCPRVRPDSKYVIWQERAVDEPHNRSRSIMGCSIDVDNVPICLYPSPTSSVDLLIYEDFPQQCWTQGSDDQSFMVITPSDGVLSLLSMSLANGTIQVKVISEASPGIDNILWIGDKYMLVSRSSILETPYLELIQHSGEHKRAVITKPGVAAPNCPIVASKLYGQASMPSFYVGPEPNVKANSVPLIVWPHGGPHAMFVNSFMHESAFLARLGFAFLKLNYIGSLGSKKDETDDLLGKIGTLDVVDCQSIAAATLKSFPCLNPQRVGVFGGSHGGFLSGHLSSHAPEFYKAAVMRNPVCDLNVMIGISDITDWCCAEVGIPFPDSSLKTFIPSAKSVEETQKLFAASPITHVSKVKAATLLLLGTQDLRVPMSQGMAYYRALKAYNKTAEVRVYPDCHPLSTVAVRTDNMIHSALWFKRFLK